MNQSDHQDNTVTGDNMITKSNYLMHSFPELPLNDLYQILQLRAAVFIFEQNCAYQDLDGLDHGALHLYKKADNGQIIAYARILQPEQCNNEHCSIGRVVVDPDFREQQLGQELMRTAVQISRNSFPNATLKISAQSYLTHFYQNLGFINTGYFYLEDDIPHQEMVYQS